MGGDEQEQAKASSRAPCYPLLHTDGRRRSFGGPAGGRPAALNQDTLRRMHLRDRGGADGCGGGANPVEGEEGTGHRDRRGSMGTSS